MLEVFQWFGTDLMVSAKQDHMAEEVADVAIYCIYLAKALGIDLAEAISNKVDANARKYPVGTSRGSSLKYTELNA